MMDTNWSNPDVVNAYRKQQEFAAEARRKKLEERKNKQAENGIHEDADGQNPIAPMLASVGQKLVALGTTLQNRYGHIEAKTAAPKLAVRE